MTRARIARRGLRRPTLSIVAAAAGCGLTAAAIPNLART